MKKAKMTLLPTGQVIAVLGVTYRTLYNYLHDYPEAFSESARVTKKGKRFNSSDMAAIQTIRHLHSERQSKDAISKALSDGYMAPLEGTYKPEDVNRLIEASWLMLQEACDILEETKRQFRRCEFCEWDLRYHIEKGFYKTIFRYEEFEHELNQIKLVVGRISDSHQARQMRDDEYERLHKWIRFHFLDEEERRQNINANQERTGLEVQQAKLQLVHDVRSMTGWLYDKLPRRGEEQLLPQNERRKGDKIESP
jgi:hypothetical protein